MFYDQNSVCIFEILQSVSDENNRFILEISLHYVIEDFLSHMSIERTQTIIYEINVSICIKGSCNRDTLLLAS